MYDSKCGHIYIYLFYIYCIVKSDEVRSSYHIEKEGLVRSLRLLKRTKFKIDTLVTNRHKQITKWFKENAPNIDRRFNIWHLAKCK